MRSPPCGCSVSWSITSPSYRSGFPRDAVSSQTLSLTRRACRPFGVLRLRARRAGGGLISMHDLAAILGAILRGYALPVRGDHGVVHWARVFENGLRLAEATGADREVVALFALFHDSRRIDDYDVDEGHGLRGGEFARSLRGSLVHLDD